MKSEWQVIEEICSKICHDESLLPDLIQDISLVWLELDPNKKTKILEEEAFSFWVARTVTNQWHSSTSTFYTKYRKDRSHELPTEIPEEEYDSTLDERTETVRVWTASLFPSDQNILRSYYESNMTIMQIANHYDVDKNFVWNTIQRVVKSFKRRAEWQKSRPKAEQLGDLIIDLIGKTRLKIEERQLVLDVHNMIHPDKFYNVYDKQHVLELLNKVTRTLQL